MRAAIELGAHGTVLCLAKRELNESNTQYAQGGIAAALSAGETVRHRAGVSSGVPRCQESRIIFARSGAPSVSSQ